MATFYLKRVMSTLSRKPDMQAGHYCALHELPSMRCGLEGLSLLLSFRFEKKDGEGKEERMKD